MEIAERGWLVQTVQLQVGVRERKSCRKETQ